MLLEALDIEKTIEGVELIKWIYKRNEQWEEVKYWDKILKEVIEKDLYTKNLYPSFVQDIV